VGLYTHNFAVNVGNNFFMMAGMTSIAGVPGNFGSGTTMQNNGNFSATSVPLITTCDGGTNNFAPPINCNSNFVLFHGYPD
jgi:hypothetical protein